MTRPITRAVSVARRSCRAGRPMPSCLLSNSSSNLPCNNDETAFEMVGAVTPSLRVMSALEHGPCRCSTRMTDRSFICRSSRGRDFGRADMARSRRKFWGRGKNLPDDSEFVKNVYKDRLRGCVRRLHRILYWSDSQLSSRNRMLISLAARSSGICRRFIRQGWKMTSISAGSGPP